ncbi:hypothetical protein [Pedobacter sp. SYSU D00535]|uniref:hypothetical protein n=1 Tax=Pedobacter sp. SYSU D00535 TaxID=2810308 RepID=UPI001A956924|nr:hypothetical protein [Pedobacter sp. SYSU D00535]
MAGFRTHFLLKGVRTDVHVNQVEDSLFAIELESANAFDEEKDPKNTTIASQRPPNLIVQKTKTEGWVILDQGSFELNHEDLQALGRAIENDAPGLI